LLLGVHAPILRLWCKLMEGRIIAGMTSAAGAKDLFKGRQFDQEIIVLCVRWYLR
jgi:hypothetical protein